jgi:hypothetical protein
MARTPSTFRQRDLTAAVKAMVAAGQKVARVELDKDGRIVLMVADPDTASGKRRNEETPDDLRKLL